MINSVFTNNKIYWLLALIVIFAGILRFYNIDQIPISLYWDEVSSTYNAYSILETGKDEFGNTIPLLFRAFEDYKTPANIYLTTIPVALFGLNELSARFTSAFLGTMTVLVSFFLIVELLKRKKTFGFDYSHIALFTSLLVAISPWHIQFSRTGFEANSGLFFVVFGAFLFFKFTNTINYKYLFTSMVVYAASIYFYRSIWIFTPLILAAFYLIYYRILFSKENLKKTILAILLFIVLIMPFMPIMVSPEGMVRARQVGVVNNSNDQVYESAVRQESTGQIGRVIYNRRIVYIIESSKGYIRHFSPEFLFLNGDGNLRHGVGGVGVLYVWAVLFIIPGIFALFKLNKKAAYISIIWLLIAPIPAAISVPTPHALRSLNMIPIVQFIIALGMFWLFSYVTKKYRVIVSAFVIGLCLYFFVNYLSIYFGDYAKKSSSEWADGYKQLVSFVAENEDDYEKIIISGHYWQPYIYFLFYNKYDPNAYQLWGSKAEFDKYLFGGTSWDMDGVELGDIDLDEMASTSNYLVAMSPMEFEKQKDNLQIINEIKNNNNELVFIVAKKK